ncbi:MAG: hypothetical protein ABH867_04475 [Patescibacteria group bacterium]
MSKIKKLLLLVFSAVLLTLVVTPVTAKGNPSSDGNCDEVVYDPYMDETGTRAELYNCKAIGNSGEEQGVYFLYDVPALQAGYPEEYGTCDILVKWSGDYGPTPYLDYGAVYNRTMCTNGYVEVWGDQFGPDDPWASTPYVYTIKGEGDQVHRPE